MGRVQQRLCNRLGANPYLVNLKQQPLFLLKFKYIFYLEREVIRARLYNGNCNQRTILLREFCRHKIGFYVLRMWNGYVTFFRNCTFIYPEKKGVRILLTQDTETRAVQRVNMEAVHCSTETI